MGESNRHKSGPGPFDPHLPDEISIRRWAGVYAIFLIATLIPLVLLIARADWTWSDWTERGRETFAQMPVAIKLLGMVVYLSVCTTFLPLPTGWLVAGVATQDAAVAAGVSDSFAVVALVTTLIVAGVGAAGSTVANLNDYHLFTWMLRHQRVAKIRTTRTYKSAAKWFARSPFWLLVIFNVMPIPVDVIRVLATTYQYPRLPFAVANFVGRFCRYGVIAFVTFWFDLGWIAVVALLALAVVLALIKLIPAAVRRMRGGSTNRAPADVS